MFVKYGNRFGVGVCFRIAYDFAGTSFESLDGFVRFVCEINLMQDTIGEALAATAPIVELASDYQITLFLFADCKLCGLWRERYKSRVRI